MPSVYSAFIPGQPPKKIFRCIGMNVSKAVIEDGKLKAFGKELLYYLDPVTGKKLDKWDNPWTGEEKLPGKLSTTRFIKKTE
jgi:S-methylmethionine-dependent homocysteine/selenocysteine methylase